MLKIQVQIDQTSEFYENHEEIITTIFQSAKLTCPLLLVGAPNKNTRSLVKAFLPNIIAHALVP